MSGDIVERLRNHLDSMCMNNIVCGDAANVLDAIDALPDTIRLAGFHMTPAAQLLAMERERGYADAMRQVKALLHPREARRER